MTTLQAITERGTRALPNGWRWVKLKHVVQINPRRPADFDRSDDAPTSFVPMEAVDDVTGTIAKRITRPFGEIKQGYTYFAEGDVLFAKITPCMQNGKQAIARELTDGIGFGTTEFHVLRPGTNMIAEWIHYFVRQPALLLEATEHFTGAVGQQRLPPDYLANLDFPLPPLAEQKRIAAILNEQMTAVERARKAAEERLEAAKALPAAFLREVFPRPDQPAPEGWEWLRLGDVCLFRRGPFGGSLRKEIFVSSGYAVYEQSHAIYEDFSKFRYFIDQEKFDEMSGFHIGPGDLIMSCSGTMGKVAIIPRNAPAGIINQALLKLTPTDSISSAFLKLWMESTSFQQSIADLTFGAAIKNVASVGLLKQLPVPLPPSEEQQRLAAFLNEQMAVMEKIHAATEAELEAIDTLPSALLRRAFNGEL